VFAELRYYPEQIQAANFFLMSEIPADVVNALSARYGTASPYFVEFLSTLGLFDHNNNPKPAWYTFASQAAAGARLSSCESRPIH
ncbi:MAG TPA: hypothetical protein VNN17_04565, partial [Terriglobia bacterium]|nr:hypothetical protein [Terriglobia bacterium]